MRFTAPALDRLRLAGALAIGQFLGRGALALGLLLLVRTLSPSGFGDLALALALVAILAALADAGFARLLVRDTARAGTDAWPLVRELLRVRMLAVVAVAAASAIAVAAGATPFDSSFGALVVAYLVLESVAFGYENAAAGAERPWRFVVAQAIAAVALLAGLTALVAADAVTLTSAMAVLAGASALKVCGHLVAWRRCSGTAKPRPPERRMAHVREALPFLGLTILAAVYYRVGVVVLYAVQGATETASYAAAFRLIDVIAVVAAIAFLGVSPALSRMHRDDPQRIWSAWCRALRLIAVFAVPLAIVVGLAAAPICGALFGSRYELTASADLRLLLPGAVLMVMQSVSAAVVFMSDDHRDVLKLTAINVSACVVASIALSSAYGSSGAAVALSLAEALSFASFAVLIRRRYGPSKGAVAAWRGRRQPPA